MEKDKVTSNTANDLCVENREDSEKNLQEAYTDINTQVLFTEEKTTIPCTEIETTVAFTEVGTIVSFTEVESTIPSTGMETTVSCAEVQTAVSFSAMETNTTLTGIESTVSCSKEQTAVSFPEKEANSTVTETGSSVSFTGLETTDQSTEMSSPASFSRVGMAVSFTEVATTAPFSEAETTGQFIELKNTVLRKPDENWNTDDSDSNHSTHSLPNLISDDSSSDSDLESSVKYKIGKKKVKKERRKLSVLDYFGDLPPLEDLHINVKEEECLPFGNVHAIVETLVVIESIPGLPPYNVDSVLFSKSGVALGTIFDIFGPVTRPYYTIRFKDRSEIDNKSLSIGIMVYCAPKTKFTEVLLPTDISRAKGSDASWSGDKEVPTIFEDYSDDDEENKTKRKVLKAKKNLSDGPHSVKKKELNQDNKKFIRNASFQPAIPRSNQHYRSRVVYSPDHPSSSGFQNFKFANNLRPRQQNHGSFQSVPPKFIGHQQSGSQFSSNMDTSRSHPMFPNCGPSPSPQQKFSNWPFSSSPSQPNSSSHQANNFQSNPYYSPTPPHQQNISHSSFQSIPNQLNGLTYQANNYQFNPNSGPVQTPEQNISNWSLSSTPTQPNYFPQQHNTFQWYQNFRYLPPPPQPNISNWLFPPGQTQKNGYAYQHK